MLGIIGKLVIIQGKCMKKYRLLLLGFSSFIVTIASLIFNPGAFLNKTVSVTLCAIFSLNGICTANLLSNSDQVLALNPPPVEKVNTNNKIDINDAELTSLTSINTSENLQQRTAKIIAQNSSNLCAKANNTQNQITFVNNSKRPVIIYWMNYQCQEVKYNTVQPGESYTQISYLNHPWRIRDAQTGSIRKEFIANSLAQRVNIEDQIVNILNEKEREIAFLPTSIKELAANTFEMQTSSNDGSKFIVTIKKQGNEIYEDSFRFVPSNEQFTGLEAFTGRFQPDGNRLDIKFDNSQESLVLENVNNDKVKATYTTATGQKEINEIPVPKNLETLPKICNSAKKFCQGVNKIDAAVSALESSIKITKYGWLKVAPKLVGALKILNPLSRYYDATKFALKITKFVCWFMFGGTPPISWEYVFKQIADIENPALKELVKVSFKVTFKFILQQNNGQLQNQIDQGLANLRKKLGLDLCDKQPSISLKAIGATTIDVNKTTTLEVTYKDPQCKARAVWVQGYTGLTSGVDKKVIPSQSYCEGTFKFGVINRGFFGCYGTKLGFKAFITDTETIISKDIVSTQDNAVVLTLNGQKGIGDAAPCNAVPVNP